MENIWDFLDWSHGSDTVTPILLEGVFTDFTSNPPCKHGVLAIFYTISLIILVPGEVIRKNKNKDRIQQ